MTSVMKRTNGNGNLPATNFSGLVDSVFRNDLSRFFNDDFWGFSGLDRRVNVPVNVRETDTSYELELVAPGLRREDFKVNVSGDLLTVSFQHQEENKEEDTSGNWLRKEYKQQSFSRSFTLADTLDANKISARYTDGILYLSLPKKEGAQSLSRTIEIS